MAGTVVGVFKNHFEAEQGAQALLDNGVPLEDITIVAKSAGGETGAASEGATPLDEGNPYLSTGVREVPQHDIEQPVNTADEAAARGVVGLVIGATLGSLVTALLIYFPYFEPIFMAHPLMSQLVGAAVGGAIGAALGVMTAGGIPPEAARAYHTEVEAGRALVTTIASSRNAPHLQDVLREHGARRLGFFTRFIDSIQSLESGGADPKNDQSHQAPAGSS